MQKRIVLTGGGTAGHVNPALAMAELLRREIPTISFLYLGRSGGRENDLVRLSGIALAEIEIRGLTSKKPVSVFETLRIASKAKQQAKDILLDYRPDLVIGTGGYVSYPVIKAAQEVGIPCVLHESNASPGLVTSLLGKNCRFVLYGTKTAKQNKKNELFVGTPVKEGFRGLTREAARKKLNIADKELCLVITGGSLGSECINSLALKLNERLISENDLKTYWFTGERYFEAVTKQTKTAAGKINVSPFSSDMPTYLCAADIAVARAGAATLSELAYTATPSVLIPSPNVKNDHQTANARVFAEAGGAFLLPEREADADTLWRHLYSLITNPDLRLSMSRKMKSCSSSDTEEKTLQALLRALSV